MQFSRHAQVLTLSLLAAGALALAPARTLGVPKPFTSIGDALHASEEGDTILVAPGIYKEVLTLHDRLTLLGVKRDETFIIGKESKPVIRGADHTLIKNFTIKGGSTGIRCEGKLMTIENCVITENKESGVHCLIALPTIRNNIICRNAWTGIFCESAHGLRGAVEHNVIADNKYSGLNLSGTTEIIIRNNIIVDNGEFAIWADHESRRSRIVYNDVFNNRKQFNQFAVVNATNQMLDPAFPASRANVIDYLQPPTRSFRQMGEGDEDIGPVAEEPPLAPAVPAQDAAPADSAAR
jgi:parallel beta-helix repeat protein